VPLEAELSLTSVQSVHRFHNSALSNRDYVHLKASGNCIGRPNDFSYLETLHISPHAFLNVAFAS